MTELAAPQPDDEREIDPQRVEFLRVRIGGDSYALERGRLRRVIRPPPITPVPRTPDVVHGVTQADREVAPVLDARRLFGESGDPDAQDRLVLIEGRAGDVLGLLVDAVETFETVDISRIDLDADADLVRALVEAPADDDPGPEAGAVDEGDSIPIVDAAALFEVASG